MEAFNCAFFSYGPSMYKLCNKPWNIQYSYLEVAETFDFRGILKMTRTSVFLGRILRCLMFKLVSVSKGN